MRLIRIDSLSRIIPNCSWISAPIQRFRRPIGLLARGGVSMTTRRYRLICSLWAALIALSAGGPARAGEGPFAFIYTLDLQPQGTWQFEQWEWLQAGQSQGQYASLTNRSELEYGFRPW